MIPSWLNRREYPFTVHTFDSLDGRLSYVDEGEGQPILFVHGNLTWSYLFRDLIFDLSEDRRCIAIDLLGFGLSDKPKGADYSGLGHFHRLAAFIDHLELSDLTLFLHDYGGPIGIEWALQNSRRVKDIVVSNSWMWSQNESLRARRLARIYGNPINRLYYHSLRASPRFFMPPLLADANMMPRNMLDQFLMPFAKTVEREGAYAMAEGLVGESSWFDSLWQRRSIIKHIPALILWGKRDEMRIAGELDRWQSVFDLNCPIEFADVGGLGPTQVWNDYAQEIRAFFGFEEALKDL